MLSILFAAASVAMSQEPPPVTGPPRPQVQSITVVGSGTGSGRPDTAEITAGVVTQSATAAQALARNTAGEARRE